MEFRTQLGQKEQQELALASRAVSPAAFGPKRMRNSLWLAVLYMVLFGGLAVLSHFLSPENSPWRRVVNVVVIVAECVIFLVLIVRGIQYFTAGREARGSQNITGSVRINGRGLSFYPDGGKGGVDLKWHDVEKALVTQRLYIFVDGDGKKLAFCKADVEDKKDVLEKYMEDHMMGNGKMVLRDE